MRHLPESFGDLSSLTSLRIDGSWQVPGFPLRIGALQNIRRLELRNFDNGLPDACKGWTKLEEVTLDSCRNIRNLPPSRIEFLTALTIRHCFDLKLPRFDLIFASHLHHVTIDSLDSNESLEALSHLTSLERLEVAYTVDNDPFPVGLFSLPSLTFVKLGCVRWMEGRNVMPLWDPFRPTHVLLSDQARSPSAIYKEAVEVAAAETNTTYPPLGSALRHLDISVDKLERSERRFISAAMCSFEWLTHLTISKLHRSTLLPIALGQLRNLRSLSLSGRFEFVPPSLSLLASSLQSLTLFPVSPSLLPPILRLTPPIPFPASPRPLPCLHPSPSLLPPISFPATPHPLPCFPSSPSLLPPIPFPASPHSLPCFPPSPSLLPPQPLPCSPPTPSLLPPNPFLAPPVSPLLPLFHPCSLCFTLAPSVSPLLPLFHPCSPCFTLAPSVSPLLPLFHPCSLCFTLAPSVSPLLPSLLLFSLSSPLLTLFTSAHSVPPCSSLPLCSICPPLLLLFPSAHSVYCLSPFTHPHTPQCSYRCPAPDVALPQPGLLLAV
ncbi:unnamed protein product [Closterium sp. Naga37s-1]|nr:unnamed protein product [Closterium sp. Naga37s-1]